MDAEAGVVQLTDDWITQADVWLRLPQSALLALREAAEILRSSAPLQELLSQCPCPSLEGMDANSFAAATRDYPKLAEQHAELLKSELNEQAGMFPMFIVLQLFPWTIHYYKAKQLPEQILLDTMSDAAIWMRHYKDSHGAWGLDNLGWLLNHLSGRLFKLGRLQFMLVRFQQPVIVLRNIHNREVAALSESGIDYRGDGLVDGTNNSYDSDTGWRSSYEQTADGYTGNPILASGTVDRAQIKLPASDWRIELSRGDTVLDIHIQEGSPLSVEASRDSLDHALRFYSKHFPEEQFRAFVCTSWLLDSQFADILPASSNIVQFQKLLHLFPVRSNEEETYRRVFGTSRIDPQQASRATGLQRAIADYASAGHLLHAAGGFRLLENR